VNNIREMLSSFARIATPYFRSEDKFAAWALLATVVVIELSIVGFDLLLNWWRGIFFTGAIQERNWDIFVWGIGVFTAIVTVLVGIQVARIYINQWLQIRWRRWLTEKYLGEWLNNANHYRMQMLGDAADNPDQRLTEDVELFVSKTLAIGTGLFNSTLSLLSFSVVLWSLSAEAPLVIAGTDWTIPGYLVWGALIYAIFGTAFTHLIGRPLIALNFLKQRFEANFRFNLVRVRENSEQIALLHGDEAERQRNLQRFGDVVTNWIEIMHRTKKLTMFTGFYTQTSVIFPYILAAPAYFANKLQLGGLQQIVGSFGTVQDSMSFFVSSYRELAEWRSVVVRLEGFEASIAQAQAIAANSETARLVPVASDSVTLDNLSLTLPDATALISADGLSIKTGEHVLVTGPSGSGKSTLFRAIAGIWPFGSGKVTIPANAKMMTLPQRPYFPIGALKFAITYPSTDGTFDDARIKQALQDVGLPALALQLDAEGHWNRTLSLGEQQRLGVARALLHAPDYLFLDEATASLDEPSEEKLYRLIEAKLPATTVVSIGHRSTLAAFHNRSLVVAPGEAGGSKFVLREAMA
jgi:vitamin B12/bleomycin/antimicrobial peptide transport system ATP-binding/permease protein